MQMISPLEVGLGVRDLARMRDFYETVMGCEFVSEVTVPAAKASQAALSNCAYTVVRLQTSYGERIKLLASENPAPVQDFNATPVPTASTCDDASAKDRNSPCSVLLDADAQAYETLYLGEEGKQACLAAADAGSGEGADPAAVKVCEPLNRNDGTFWGYGLKNANQ